MSNILFLRGFNNYHKRTIIKYSDLEDYETNSASFLIYSGINFNPNDGILTELVVGNSSQLENGSYLKFDENGSPDYLVVFETGDDSSVTIKSRWFVLESVKTTAGQYRLALKRDVIADHMDWILKTDCFIEKAQIMDINSPFLFNNESMTYNQIKKKEIPLYDSTGVPWIVGYIAKNYDTLTTVTGKAINVQNTSAYDMADLPWGTLTSTQIKNGITFDTVDTLDLFVRIRGQYGIYPVGGGYGTGTASMIGRSAMLIKDGALSAINNNFGYFFTADPNGNIASTSGSGLGIYTDSYTSIPETNYNGAALPINSYPRASSIKSAQDIMNNLMGKEFNGNDIATNVVNEITATSLTDWTGQNIAKYDGKQVRIDDGNGGYIYYTMKVSLVGYSIGSNISSSLASSSKSSIISLMNSTLNEMDDIAWTSKNVCDLFITYGTYKIEFSHVPASLEVDVTIPTKSGRWGCNDQLFDIFCIPYGVMEITDDVRPGSTPIVIKTNPQAGLAAARAMAQQLGSNLYDLQILPYCPIKYIRDSCNTYINMTGATPYLSHYYGFEIDSDDSSMDGSYQRITDAYDNTIVYNYVFWATESHGTFDVDIMSTDDMYYQYDGGNGKYREYPATSPLKKKISNETEIFRLCSPNYSGLFEYSPAKNNNLPDLAWSGLAQAYFPTEHHINVDYTYRPGNPYIHLNPIFNGEDSGAIYGQDWNDVRGLICGGDFSLGYIVDAYRQYQIQNANFQNIFDRQIANLDFNNALAKEQTQFASIMSAIGLPVAGATTGAITGAKAGGGYGAAIGAVVGGVGGGVGGIAGYSLNMEWLEKQQQETRSYAVDMYNYNLGNIKALPYSISRTDCLAENTRLVPFLELYQATGTEVNNLKNVLKYNGMTVMAIDKPENYISSDSVVDNTDYAITCHNKACYYIKAKIIMNIDTELGDDFHIIDSIYQELDKGVYIQGYEEE